MKICALILAAFLPFQVASEDPKRLVVIGDSITEGYGVSQDQAYPALLQKLLQKNNKNWRVINSSISGSTSAGATDRVKWNIKQKPAIIILALGSNDGLRGQDVKAIEANIARALAEGKKAQIKMVLAGLKMPPNYGNAYSKSFAELFPRVAAKENVPMIPFLLEGVAGKSELNLSDGIHPNEKGHVIVSELVYRAIEKLL